MATTWYLDPEGGSDYDDASPAHHPMTLSGSAVLSSTQAKFGNQSLDLTVSNSLSSWNTPSSSDFQFGSGMFTIEGWVYFSTYSATTEYDIFAIWGASEQSFVLGFDTTGRFALYYSTTGTDNPNVGAAYTPTTGQWIHFAADRDASNVLRVYANGVVIASATVAAAFFASTAQLAIGNNIVGGRCVDGYIDAVKFRKGAATYGGAFTPPTSAPTVDAQTVLLLNMETGGQTFASRKATLGAITPAAGDTIRVMASRDPIGLGTATWTDNSGTITLASAVNALVDDFETAWTAAANVTAGTSTTYRKSGSACGVFQIGSSFSGGLIAYKAVSNLDLSAYTCLSLWLLSSTAFTQKLSIALCSDSAGATPIVTLTMPILYPAGSYPWVVRLDNGGVALPSGINSIAIYSNSGKPYSSSGSFYMDNLIACTTWGSANHLSHGCLIGKNTTGEPEWYSLMSINGTTVVIGNHADYTAAAPACNYRGTTGTVATYSLCPTQPRWTTTTNASIGGSGTIASPITISGGWDRTAMSTQSGQTWMSGEFWTNYPIYNAAGRSYISYPDKTIGFAHYTGYAYGVAGGWVLKILGMTACNTGLNFSPSTFLDMDLGNLIQMEGTLSLPAGMGCIPLRMRVRRIALCSSGGASLTSAAVMDDVNSDIEINLIDANLGYGLYAPAGGRLRVRGTTLQNNSSGSVNTGSNTGGGEVLLDRPVLNDATVFAGGGATINPVLRVTAANGNAWDNRVYSYFVKELSVTSPVHGTTAQSRQITVNVATGVYAFPYRSRLARIACVAGTAVTVKVWQQRSSTTLNYGLQVMGGQLAGVADQTVLGTAAINTWEQVSLSFTPTENGVIDIFASVQSTDGATSGVTATFGDMSIT